MYAIPGQISECIQWTYSTNVKIVIKKQNKHRLRDLVLYIYLICIFQKKVFYI